MAIAQGVFVALSLMSIASSAYSIHQQRQAAADAESAGRRQARRIETETQERAKRLRYMQERQRASAYAQLAAAGIVAEEGSAARYLQELLEIQTSELDWLELSGRLRAETAIETGRLAGLEAETGITSSFANLFAQAGQSAYQYESMWGK